MPHASRNRPRYAARLNAFRLGLPGKPGIREMIGRAAEVGGLDAADLNYPDHFEGHSATEIGRMLGDAGMALNGLAMRFYTDPGFRLGAFTHPDPATRQAAIDLTRRGLDALAEMGGSLMTLWMGQDGFDYSFQAKYARLWDDTVAALRDVADHAPGIDTALGLGAPLMTLWMGQDGFDYAFQLDYARAWDDTIAALEEVCAHAPDCDIALEYKPNEPRAFALMPDIGTTLLAIREADRPNLGVTLDFAHVLYADEMPAHAAHLIARHSKLLGVHLNDGYGKRDDGLMAGTVHPVQTVELFVELDRIGYDGVIYFDTFPDHGGLDPVEEARTNLEVVEHLRAVAGDLGGDRQLATAIGRQDAATAMRIVARRLYGMP